MSKSESTQNALAILGDRALSYDQAILPKVQAAALQQLAEVARLGRERAARATLAGLALLRVKASLKHSEFLPWLRANTGKGTTSCSYYMRLAMIFVEKSGVSKPDLLALPGDQTALAGIEGDEAQRRFFTKLEKFVGQDSLSELLEKHSIKKAPKLGGARVPALGMGEAEDPAAPAPIDAEALAAQKREEISAWLAAGRALLVAENACQYLPEDDVRSILDGLDALRTDLRAALRHVAPLSAAPDLAPISDTPTGTEA